MHRLNNPIEYNTIQYNTIQYNTLQYNTMDTLFRITNNEVFSFKENTTDMPRLRRLPRGMRCITDAWMSNTSYKIDNERSTDKFLMFTMVDGEKVNWWIDIEKKQICYDASSDLSNHTEKDDLSIFEFKFT